MKITVIFAVLSMALASSRAKRVLCYYANWKVYGPDPFKVDSIDPTLCTHISYSFLGMDESGNIISLDPWNDFGDQWTEGNLKKFQKLRSLNPSVKLLVSIGGWGEGPFKFQSMVRSPEKRKNFLTSTIDFLRQYKFDGIDIAWIYHDPIAPLGDKAGYVQLLQELKPKYKEYGLILSVSTSAHPKVVETAYDLPAMSKNLDFFNIISYDLHGSWDRKTGHVAPLHAHSKETELERWANVEAVLRNYIKSGASPDKINVGLVGYGRTFTLFTPSNHGLNSPTVGPGKTEPLAYGAFCLQDKNGLWKKYRDSDQKIPYAVAGDQWVGYEDTTSLIDKVKFIKTLNIGGVTFWSLDQDDFKGVCGGGKFPLLRAAKEELLK